MPRAGGQVGIGFGFNFGFGSGRQEGGLAAAAAAASASAAGAGAFGSGGVPQELALLGRVLPAPMYIPSSRSPRRELRRPSRRLRFKSGLRGCGCSQRRRVGAARCSGRRAVVRRLIGLPPQACWSQHLAAGACWRSNASGGGGSGGSGTIGSFYAHAPKLCSRTQAQATRTPTSPPPPLARADRSSVSAAAPGRWLATAEVDG
jgi:hypothetical protein